ncbi:hypothetical protein HY085_02565 [Candidatus Gottesmanbacteria bacterium]|nr:hypothetical protein [Candidatus Gottesmanbacteria bacterium]
MLKLETDEAIFDLLKEEGRNEREKEIERILNSPSGKKLWSKYKNLLGKILSCRWTKKDIPKPRPDIEISWSPNSYFIRDILYYPVLDERKRDSMGISEEIYTARLLISSPVSKYPSVILTYNYDSAPAEIKLKFDLGKRPHCFSFFADGHSRRHIMTGRLDEDIPVSLSTLDLGYRPDPQEIFNQLYGGIIQFEPIVSDFIDVMSKSTPTVHFSALAHNFDF